MKKKFPFQKRKKNSLKKKQLKPYIVTHWHATINLIRMKRPSTSQILEIVEKETSEEKL